MQYAPDLVDNATVVFDAPDLIYDDESQPGLGIFGAFQLLTNASCAGIIGAANSAVSIQTSYVASYMGAPQISGASTSTELSVKSSFPSFTRTIGSDQVQFAVMAALVHYYGWTRVGFIHTNDAYGETGFQAFSQAAQQYGISIVDAETILYDARSNNVDMAPVLARLASANARIICTAFVTADAQYVFEAAWNATMIGPGPGASAGIYVWVGSDGWMLDDLTVDWPLGQAHPELLRGTVGTRPGCNQTTPAFAQLAAQLNASADPASVNPFTCYTFDAAWLYLFALNRTIGSIADINEAYPGVHLDPTCLQRSMADINVNAYPADCALPTAVSDALYARATCNATFGYTADSCVPMNGVAALMQQGAGRYADPQALLLYHVYSVSFVGTTGQVALDENGDRLNAVFLIVNGQTVFNAASQQYENNFAPIGLGTLPRGSATADVSVTAATVYPGGTDAEPNLNQKPADGPLPGTPGAGRALRPRRPTCSGPLTSARVSAVYQLRGDPCGLPRAGLHGHHVCPGGVGARAALSLHEGHHGRKSEFSVRDSGRVHAGLRNGVPHVSGGHRCPVHCTGVDLECGLLRILWRTLYEDLSVGSSASRGAVWVCGCAAAVHH